MKIDNNNKKLYMDSHADLHTEINKDMYTKGEIQKETDRKSRILFHIRQFSFSGFWSPLV